MRWDRVKKVVFLLAASIVILVVLVVLWRLGLTTLLVRKRADGPKVIEWTDMGEVPDGAKKITPQGMTWADGRLLMAVSWRNEHCRIYSYDPPTMKIKASFLMPKEAVHTSGLAWDGEVLWGVDYISNRCYRIDLGPSLVSGEAVVLGSFDTGLRGTSACCVMQWEGRDCLAISDFRNTRETLLVETKKAIESGRAVGAVIFSYRNEGFSQGLEFFDGRLWESENKLGINVINEIDLELLKRTRSARQATVHQYPAPSWGVEDLAWDGIHLWTSDETTFKVYRGVFCDR